MAVTPDDVRHVAQLARLGVSEASLPALVSELNGILGHMQVLSDVRLDDTSVSTGPMDGMPLRDDVPSATALAHSRESFAPHMRDGFFLVPRLATHGATSDANLGDSVTGTAEFVDEDEG